MRSLPVLRDDRGRIRGVPWTDTLGWALFGARGVGKTQVLLCRAVAAADRGHSVFLLDPHGAAADDLARYIAPERLVWISAMSSAASGVTWNPFDVDTSVTDRFCRVRDGLASSRGWTSDSNPQSFSVMSKVVLSLSWVAEVVEDRPTLWEIEPMLTDTEFRETVVAFLRRHNRETRDLVSRFWRARFPSVSAAVIARIVRLVDDLSDSATIPRMMRQSTGDYDARRFMDEGKVVIVRLSGASETDRIAAGLFVSDLIRAIKTRPPEADNHPVSLFLDEIQSYETACKAALASLVREGRKFLGSEGTFTVACQEPGALSRVALRAVLNNSNITTGRLSKDAAGAIYQELGVSRGDLEGLPDHRMVVRIRETAMTGEGWGLHLPRVHGAPRHTHSHTPLPEPDYEITSRIMTQLGSPRTRVGVR